MPEKSVEPLIAAARVLELSARRSLCDNARILAVAADTLKTMRGLQTPSSIRFSPRTLCGPRVDLSPAKRGGLATTAFWPQDQVEATRFPILCGALQGEADLPVSNYSLQIPAENFVFFPANVPHPNGSQPHLSEKSKLDFCDLFWLYRWEGGLICHICHSRGNLHANFRADENCFLIGKQSMLFFDLLADAISSQPDKEKSANLPAAVAYLLPALLAIVGDDLSKGRFVQPGVLPAARSAEDNATNKVSKEAHGQRGDSAKWKENYGTIMQTQNFIAFHLDQPLCINGMAQMACMSRAQFTQLFRRATGKSFVQYLTAARLERAKIFLRETDWSVEVVAHAVGWKSAHLWKMFARELNITPGEFRRAGNEASDSKPAARTKKSVWR